MSLYAIEDAVRSFLVRICAEVAGITDLRWELLVVSKYAGLLLSCCTTR